MVTARTIEVPSFDFSAFYYPQILEALIAFKRANVPELTDESDFEPSIQLLRGFALVGHLNNVLVDLVANESTLPTSQLPETVRNMLRLIDFELRPATPASVDLVYELSRVFTTSFELISEDARAATRATDDSPAIPFEALTAQTLSATDAFTKVLTETAGPTFVDHTVAANTGAPFTPDLTAAGNKLYFGHDSVMWTKSNIVVSVAGASYTGVWEFHDGDFSDVAPDLVTDIGGGQLEFELTSLLGASNRAGATVRVRSNVTGALEDVVSTWNGTENIATTGLLGQTVISTDVADYTVGTEWTEFALSNINFADATLGLQATPAGDFDVEYDLPQTALLNWQETTINGQLAWWKRFRIITDVGATSPTLGLCRMDTGKQFALALVTQGRSVEDNPLGSSTGAPLQRFETTRDFFVLESEVVLVDSEIWTSVTDFLASTSQDKHYIIELGDNDRATVSFGDGVNGRIPPIGVNNISIGYRVDANNDGNVGANTIEVDKTGLTFVGSLFNPRQAGGWATAQGSTPESLEQAKIEGPASLRVKEVALSSDDLIVLTKRFLASDGTQPFSRATFIEEGFGEKTVELIVVGRGGVVSPQTVLDELDLYFNGNRFAQPPVEKHYIANSEVTSVSFDPKAIDVVAIVEVTQGVTAQQIINRLNQVIQPEALKADGVTFEWDFGADVPTSRISHEIHDTDERITKVTLTTPASDVALDPTELPVIGTVSITIVEV